MATVQAQSMSAQMGGMASDMISFADKACEHCQAGKDMTMPCVTVCAAPSFALIAAQDAVPAGVSIGRLPFPKAELLFGIGLQPPHSPPRTTYIG